MRAHVFKLNEKSLKNYNIFISWWFHMSMSRMRRNPSLSSWLCDTMKFFISYMYVIYKMLIYIRIYSSWRWHLCLKKSVQTSFFDDWICWTWKHVQHGRGVEYHYLQIQCFYRIQSQRHCAFDIWSELKISQTY